MINLNDYLFKYDMILIKNNQDWQLDWLYVTDGQTCI
jgi:hypothetical protein